MGETARWQRRQQGDRGDACSIHILLVTASKAKTTDSMDSGVVQPTDIQVRIIFADGGWISKHIAKSLIKDDREQLETQDLLESAELFEASIIIGSNFPARLPIPSDSGIRTRLCESNGMHATSWHVWYDSNQWTVKKFNIVPMSRDHPRLRGRECAMMHLCHHSGFQITVIFVKVLRGNSAADDSLQLDHSGREAVVNAVFSFLCEERSCPVIVAGDLGVGLSTLHAYIRDNALQDKVQTHCINKQCFHSLFRNAPNQHHRCTSLNADLPRILAYQVESNSGDQHPTAKVIHRSKHAALTPCDQVHMKFLQQLTDGAGSILPDSDDAHLTVEALYQPIAEQAHDKQGVLHTSPIDADVSGKTFVSAILLLKQIRDGFATRGNKNKSYF